MPLKQIAGWLGKGEAQSEDFRRESEQHSLSGLKLMAAAHVAFAAFWLLESSIRFGPGAAKEIRAAALLALLALAAFFSTRVPWFRGRPRPLAWIFAALSALLAIAAINGGAEERTRELLAVVFISITCAVPLPAVAVLGLGAIAEAAAFTFAHAVPSLVPYLAVLSAACTFGSALLDSRRRMEYRARQEAARISEALSSAQVRAQLIENAASVGKLAAAVTHEINTPLGALRSGIGTLNALAERRATAPEGERDALRAKQQVLSRSLEASCDRIQSVVSRLQRFVDLHDAELKITDLNELLSNVSLLFDEQIGDRIRLEFDFGSLPPVACRPQLLGAVFSALISNSINAIDDRGAIRISTRREDSRVEIRFQDNGRGMSPEEVDTIFDPGFKVSQSRVRSS